MFKVLIVDDEPMAIEAVKLAADWEKLNLFICGECGNGKEALKLVNEVRPDLIITDVSMPVMDGIELVRRVIEDIDSDIKFILVSGHEEFEYVKSAMQLGVEHYILKPIFNEELSAVLLQIIPSLEQNKKLKNICSISTEFDMGILFEKFLAGKMSEKALKTRLDKKLIQKSSSWAYATLDTIQNFEKDDFEKDDYIGFKIFDKIKDSLSFQGLEDIFVYPVFGNNSTNGFILCSVGKTPIDEIAYSLCIILKQAYRSGFYLAIGNQVKDFAQLGNSMKEAQNAMRYRFYSSPGSVLLYKDYTECSLRYNFENFEYIEEVENAFENIDKDRILRAIDTIFEVFKDEHIVYEIIEMYLNSIIYKSLSILTSMGENIDDIPFIINVSKIFITAKTINEMKILIKQYCIDFCNHAQSIKNKYKLADKMKVEEYIKQNYRRNLTIKEISSKLYIHPTYLGSQISKWFGCSFNCYLHNLRMKEAEELIKNTNQKTHQIAQYLGYTSYSNFLEQFTKTFSMKPSEYRTKFI